MEIDSTSLEVRHDEARRRFEVEYDGRLSELTYDRREGAIRFLHTGVPRELEGHGIAGRLAQEALDYAREQGLQVVPLCPYVRKYIQEHPEYEALVRQGS